MRMNDVILQTMTAAVAFIILTFSIFLFFAGHNNPGGGFIGGLVSAAGLILLYLAYDVETMDRVFPVNYLTMTALGLLIAVLTGVGSFLFDVPFLSHTFDYFNLPLLGETELATAVIFDLGVYLTVVGVTMSILLTIGGDVDKWKS